MASGILCRPRGSGAAEGEGIASLPANDTLTGIDAVNIGIRPDAFVHKNSAAAYPWMNPPQGMDLYEARLDVVTGILPTFPDLYHAQWIPVSSNHLWILDGDGAARSGSFDLKIRRISDQTEFGTMRVNWSVTGYERPPSGPGGGFDDGLRDRSIEGDQL
jgi:hypothetical protein